MKAERNVWIVAASFCVLWVIYGQLSPGTFNDDDVVHFFMARQSLKDPSLWISLWGRPLFTVVYAVPASIGYGAVELTTAIISSLTLVMTWKLARAVGVRHQLAAVLLAAWQPFVFKLGFSCLVEPLGALCLTTGLWASLTRRDRLAALVAGLLPLTRFELITVVPFLLLPALRRSPRSSVILAALPLVVWNLAGWGFEGDPFWLMNQLLGGHFTRSFAGERHLLHYFRALPMVTGGAVMPLLLLGLFWWRQPDARGANTVRIVFLTVLLTLALLAWDVHDFGGSVGYLRHLVAVGPLIGVLAALGLDRWFSPAPDGTERVARIGLLVLGVGACALIPALDLHLTVWEHPVNRSLEPWGWVAASVGVGVLLLMSAGATTSRRWVGTIVGVAAISTLIAEPPIPLSAEQRMMEEAVSWVEHHGRNRVVSVNHPWFFFLGGYDRYDDTRFPTLTRENLERLPRGSVVIWEDHYSPRLSGDVPIDYFAPYPERYATRHKNFLSRYFKYLIFEVVGERRSS